MLIHSPSDLAQYYRDQRKLRGMSQATIAEEIAVRQDTVSKFELKPDNVRLETVFRLLAALRLAWLKRVRMSSVYPLPVRRKRRHCSGRMMAGIAL